MNASSPHSSLMVFNTITGSTETAKKTITGRDRILLDTHVSADLMETVVPTQVFAAFATHWTLISTTILVQLEHKIYKAFVNF